MNWRSMMMATAVATADPILAIGAPDVTEVTEDDASMIRVLVRDQLAAFADGDADRAWSVCSEAIRGTFEDAADLLATIRRAYHPLVRHRSLDFGSFVITPSGLGILLEVMDPSGDLYEALYLVQRDGRGAWRVHGCMMLTEDDDEGEGLALAA